MRRQENSPLIELDRRKGCQQLNERTLGIHGTKDQSFRIPGVPILINLNQMKKMKVSLMLCLWCIMFQPLNAQIPAAERAVLMGILENNCLGCPLEDSSSLYFWDTTMVVTPVDWPGIQIEQQHVVSINLSGVGLTGIFNGISNLPSLKSIRCDSNQITGLSNVFTGDSTILDSIDFSHNLLQTFPQLPVIQPPQYLNLSFNRLNDWPLKINPLQFTDSVFYDFSHNSIARIESDRYVPDLGWYFEGPIGDIPHDSPTWGLFCGLNPCSKSQRVLLDHNPLDSIDMEQSGYEYPFCVSAIGCHLDFRTLYNSEVVGHIENIDSMRLLEYDSLLFLSGASCDLNAYPRGGPWVRYQWFQDSTIRTGDTSGILTISSSSPAHYWCEMTSDLYPGYTHTSRPVHIGFATGIRCSDPNLDSLTSILDVVGVGMFYGQQGAPRPIQYRGASDSLLPAYDWLDSIGQPRTLHFEGREINLKHFDANGDGQLTETDLDCVIEEMRPLQWQKRGLHQELGVTPSVSLRAVPLLDTFVTDSNGRFVLIYKIEIDSLGAGIDSLPIKGLTFIRPEAENNIFSIDSMWGDFFFSEFGGNTPGAELLGITKFYPELKMDSTYFINRSCLGEVVSPLEVAIFRKHGFSTLSNGARIVDCLVSGDIDDLKIPGSGQPLATYFPFVMETTNIVLFEANGNTLTMHPGFCTTDTVVIKNNKIAP